MGCSCRITPVRFFIQGLAQVHQLEASSSLRLRSPTMLRNCFAGPTHTRYLHATRPWRDDHATANAAPVEPVRAENPAAAVPANESTPAEKPGTAAAAAAATTPELAPSARDASVLTPTVKSRGKKDLSSEERHARWRLSGDTLAIPRIARKPSPPVATLHAPTPPEERKVPLWKSQKEALAKKFPEGWKPRKRLSPDALAGIRALNAQFPDVYTTERLATKFEVPAEAIRRILRSKWQPSVDEEIDRQERWNRRGESVYRRKVAMGFKAPRKWREAGIARDPSYHEWRQGAVQRNRAFEGEGQTEGRRSRAEGERETRNTKASRG